MLIKVIALSLLCVVSADAQNSRPPRKCEAVPAVEACYWVKGRISLHNGTPAFRLWVFDTNHLLGIYSDAYGLSHGDLLDNEHPMMPDNVENILYKNDQWARARGDFLVCPLEPMRNGRMQAACVQKAKNIHKVN
jgi:hypothetical protein